MTNRERFQAELTRQYTDLFANDPSYAHAKAVTTPDALAEKMTTALLMNDGHKGGMGIRLTCDTLNIHYTYAAILAYLTS